jgi:hypothetical protein
MRPRLLLVPEFTELQWTIRPALEEWAEVRSYDAPGIGSEPRPEDLSNVTGQLLVDRGLEEIDRAGWESFFLVADGWAIGTAVGIAKEQPEATLGLALGHASLSQRRAGERAPVNGEIYAAVTQLVENDAQSFIRYAIVQATGGSVDEDEAAQIMSRVPKEDMAEGWKLLTADEPFEEELRGLDHPLLLAKHEGCLMMTDEGFEDAVAALPGAEVIVTEKAPCTSPEFAQALRRFCEGLSESRT